MRWMLPVVVATAIVGTMTASQANDTAGRSAGARAGDKVVVSDENQRLLISSDDAARAGEYWNVERMEKAQPMPEPDVGPKAPVVPK
ncbi:MAG: hypothetical protein WDN31_12090 [Hyphomicrobium sp.]